MAGKLLKRGKTNVDSPRSTPRLKWLDSLKYGDEVLFTHRNGEKVMKIRLVSDGLIFLVDADRPKMDLAHGEVVWQENGEAPFGERIEPIGEL